MENAVAVQNTSMDMVMGADLSQVTKQLQAIANFQVVVQQNLKSGQDFGVIPGTNKPTLLKPGAEKIQMLFGVTSEYEEIERIQDYDKGFFAYTIKCTLSKNGQKITEGMGHCNTKEKKYVKQDPFTLANTCLKMAKKRAQIDATLTIASLSEVFTQDMEDLQGFMDKEQMETMNDNDASGMKVTFGKYKGKTIGEILNDDRSYVEWLAKNAKQDAMKQAATMLLSGKTTEPKKKNSAQSKKATVDQIAEIELMIDVISTSKGLSPEEFASQNKISGYKNFNEQQAKRCIEFLQKQAPQEPFTEEHAQEQEALFNDMNPPFEGEVYDGPTPFDD